MTGEVERYLVIAAGMFILGAIGFLTRRNLILIFLSAELMMHGIGLTFVTFGRMHFSNEGQVMNILALTVAACEAGFGLALILGLFQLTRSLDIELWTDLRELDLPAPVSPDDLTSIELPEEQKFPTLTPAGRLPEIPKRPVVIKRNSTTPKT
ncbi:MAG TPA: NADH-quinone oxidoreductase subunit NuoK [Planctomicrobium sp.]|nr:NADH-quinone oxidoreductase subunit NuoK [Planctomicrobium sp.]